MKVMKMSKHVKNKISLYIDGMLDDAQVNAFEKHVKTCGECANALAGTKRAVASAKKPAEQPLPVNFYAKLNQKLDAVDAKKDAFSWVMFTRGAAAVFTMLIVGVFVYNIKNQTNNFTDMNMKTGGQAPAEMQANAPVEADKPALKAADEDTGKAIDYKVVKEAVKDGYLGTAQEAAPLKPKSIEKKVAVAASRAVKVSAPSAKLDVMSSVSSAGASASKMAEASIKGEASVPAAAMQSMADTASVESWGKKSKSEAFSMDEAGVAEEAEVSELSGSGPKTYVFKSEKDWKLFSTSNGMQEPEKIDWSRQMLVVVISPGKPTAGYSIEITDVEYLANKVIVRYRESAPAPGSMNAQVITSPARAKAVDKSDLPVAFEEAK